MANNKLTTKFCDNAPKGNHFDGDGLYLLVQDDGKKYWRMACYLNGKRKLLAFGRYPKVSLAKAREEKTKAQELLNQGIDPVQQVKEKLKAHESSTRAQAKTNDNQFEQVARRLHESKKGKTTEEHRFKIIRHLEIHIFPIIGHKDITLIKGAELLRLFQDVAKKENHGRVMTYMAKALCQLCSEIFEFAHIENDDFTSNPCKSLFKHLPTHNTINMLRIRFKELPSFLKSLKNYNGNLLTKAAIWTLLYTGMRQASIRRCTWGDFDLDENEWNRKPEKSDKLIHSLPLPSQAIHLLNQIKPLTGATEHDLVFPSIYNPHHMMSEAAICQAIKRMNYKMVGHGLRGVVSTGLNELGYPPHIVEAQLGHKIKNAVEAAYNHATYFDERTKMMQEWADYLDSLVK